MWSFSVFFFFKFSCGLASVTANVRASFFLHYSLMVQQHQMYGLPCSHTLLVGLRFRDPCTRNHRLRCPHSEKVTVILLEQRMANCIPQRIQPSTLFDTVYRAKVNFPHFVPPKISHFNFFFFSLLKVFNFASLKNKSKNIWYLFLSKWV